jgi:hypothetical protein
MEVATVRLYVSEKHKTNCYIFLSLCILQAQRGCHTLKNVENFQTNSSIHSINISNKYPTKYHKLLNFLKSLDYGKDTSEIHRFIPTRGGGGDKKQNAHIYSKT